MSVICPGSRNAGVVGVLTLPLRPGKGEGIGGEAAKEGGKRRPPIALSLFRFIGLSLTEREKKESLGAEGNKKKRGMPIMYPMSGRAHLQKDGAPENRTLGFTGFYGHTLTGKKRASTGGNPYMG